MRRPIIFYRYAKPVDMLDSHSYDKMSRVMRMLHAQVGDNAWRAALQLYVKDHAYQAVSYQDLQEIFERQSGENLDWFFQQWLLKPGHPSIRIQADTLNGRHHIRIIQMQDIEKQPVYRFPLDLEFTYGQQTEKQTVWVEKVDSTYDLTVEPHWSDVIPDPSDIVLAEITQQVEKEQLIDRLKHPSVSVRYQALNKLDAVTWDSTLTEEVKKVATSDSWWGIRRTAMVALVAHRTPDLASFGRNITHQTEEEGRVRIHALYLTKDDTSCASRRYLKSMLNDPSYFVAAEAISLFGRKYPASSFDILEKFKDQPSYRDVIKAAFAQTMRYSEDPKATEVLLEMVQTNGTAQYISDALRSLYVRQQMGKTDDADQHTLLQTCYQKLSRRDAGQTSLCLDIIEELADENQISTLQNIQQKVNLSDAAEEHLQSIINQLTIAPATDSTSTH